MTARNQSTAVLGTDADATATRITGAGRAAVAVVKYVGPPSAIESYFRSMTMQSVTEQPLNSIRYGRWRDEGEDVVVVRTAEYCFEIHCHGGETAVNRILTDLTAAGSAIHSQSEIISSSAQPAASEAIRNFEDAHDILVAELYQAVQSAPTRRTAHLLLRQAQLLPDSLRRLQQATPTERRAEIDKMLLWSKFGAHLIRPWQVVLCGQPNVGKSSLINSMLGFSRSVVYDEPGTTRDTVTGTTAVQGWPLTLYDTAGLRETGDLIESLGIKNAVAAVEQADLILIVTDDQESQLPAMNALVADRPYLSVRNKSDLAASRQTPSANEIAVSALTGEGIEPLLNQIVTTLIPLEPEQRQTVPVTHRHVEWLQRMQDEL